MTNRVAKNKRPVARNGVPGPRYPHPDSKLAKLEREVSEASSLPRRLRQRLFKLCARYNMDAAAFVRDAVTGAVANCEQDSSFLISTIEACNSDGVRQAWDRKAV